MTTNYRREGDSVLYSNTGAAIASGDVVIINNLIGVALEDIAATTGTGWVAIAGTFSLPAVSAAVISQGEKVIWDVSAGEFDDDQATPAAGDVSNGAVALEDSGNGVTSVVVRLNPGNGTVT